jgi:hypothetical protein
MRWFQGGIAEAVAASKSRNAIFVVFVEGWFEVLLQLERVTPISILECHKLESLASDGVEGRGCGAFCICLLPDFWTESELKKLECTTLILFNPIK